MFYFITVLRIQHQHSVLRSDAKINLMFIISSPSKVSYYVFNNLVRDDLDEMVKEHNDHRIRSQRNPEIITGKPNLLYRMPEKVGKLCFGSRLAEKPETRDQSLAGLPVIFKINQLLFKPECVLCY